MKKLQTNVEALLSKNETLSATVVSQRTIASVVRCLSYDDALGDEQPDTHNMHVLGTDRNENVTGENASNKFIFIFV